MMQLFETFEEIVLNPNELLEELPGCTGRTRLVCVGTQLRRRKKLSPWQNTEECIFHKDDDITVTTQWCGIGLLWGNFFLNFISQ